ncbi:MAG: BBP7 family outer membrane beta-barrel protein, partial [Planctomycetales bacterium]|nr:BBP7 family outer membrane beta-barrel protein [Planctomycetales bacterium]
SVFNEGSTNSFSGQTTGGAGSGTPILARPFFDVNAGLENARLASFPAISDGSITVSSSSEIHSAGLLLRRRMTGGPHGKIDLLAGYRYFRFREGMRIDENFVSTGAGGGIAVGTAIDVYDLFETENDFHGGELGLATRFDRGSWGLELLGKVAIGGIHRSTNINGATTTTTPAPGSTTSTASGGLLALSSNIARTSENDFAVLPEFGANLTFELNDSLQLRAGYTILALNNVARTGNQIDRNINTNLIPGGSGAGPAVPSHTRHELSDFWAQGLNFGIAGEF